MSRDNHHTLSVYLVDGSSSQIERVVGAYCLADSPRDLTCVLIEAEMLSSIELDFEQEDAETPDDLVNSQHYNLIEISGKKLAGFARLTKDALQAGQYHSYDQNAVLDIVVKSVKEKNMEKIEVINKQSASVRTSSKTLIKTLENLTI